jgi:hypothetical protein
MTIMAFKCKTCGTELPTKQRLEIHKKVHKNARRRKSKIYEYGDPQLRTMSYLVGLPPG